MLGVKRRPPSACPDRPQSKLTKDDALSIYESTLQKLLAGSGLILSSNGDISKPTASMIEGQESTSGDASFSSSGSTLTPSLLCISKSNSKETSSSPCSVQSQGNSCFFCSTGSQENSCFNCRRVICDKCFQLCEQCQEYFCLHCSIHNFNKQHDRIYCLGCNLEDEGKKHRISTS